MRTHPSSFIQNGEEFLQLPFAEFMRKKGDALVVKDRLARDGSPEGIPGSVRRRPYP